MPGKIVVIISFMLFFIQAAKAQLTIPYVISGFSFSDRVVSHNNFVFLDSGKCLIAANGLALYFALQDTSKTFNPVCPEDVPGLGICPLVGYPNPTSGMVTLKSGLCYNQYNFLKGILSVTDVYGNTLIKKDILLDDIRNGYKVNLAPYGQGVYFFRIYFLNNSTVIKILKNTSAGGH